MHGRENACSPVFICRQAPLWLMLSATIERMTHRSSTQVANCGNSSLTSVPDWPCFSKVYGRSEEHTSEFQSQSNLVCRLLLEKKKKNQHSPVCMRRLHSGSLS